MVKPSSTEYLGGRDLIQYLFDTAKASNISVMRTLIGSADDSDDFVLQTAPGKLLLNIFAIPGHMPIQGYTPTLPVCDVTLWAKSRFCIACICSTT